MAKAKAVAKKLAQLKVSPKMRVAKPVKQGSRPKPLVPKEIDLGPLPLPDTARPAFTESSSKLDFDLARSLIPYEKPRDLQVDAVAKVIDAHRRGARYVILEAPTGTGKAGIGVALSRYFHKAFIGTLTAQLQEQYAALFKSHGVEKLLGAGKFSCKNLPGGTCADGRREYKGKQSCQNSPGGCAYAKQKGVALASPICVANFHSLLYNVAFAADEEDGGFPKVRPLMVLDECFPAGTSVSGRPIEQWRAGDTIASFDERKGQRVLRTVMKTMRTRPTAMVRLHFRNGKVLSVTANHPFLTPSGWCPAIDLSGHPVLSIGPNDYSSVPVLQMQEALQSDGKSADNLTMASTPQNGALLLGSMSAQAQGRAAQLCNVQEIVPGFGATTLQCQTSQPELLLHKMLPPRESSFGEKDGQTLCEVGVPPHETRKPHVGPEGQNASHDLTSCFGDVVPEGAGGQWEGANSSRAIPFAGTWMADERDCTNEGAVSGLPDALQAGRRRSDAQSGHRGGWKEPLLTQDTRQEEGRVLAQAWVDRVEVLEPGSDGTFGGVCPDGHVYNLEVEGTHTYFVGTPFYVGGLIVHNCHGAEGMLMGHTELTIKLNQFSFQTEPLPGKNESIDAYWAWLKVFYGQLLDEAKDLPDPKDREKANEVATKVRFAMNAKEDEAWIPERGEREGGTVDPTWFSLKPLTVKRWGHWLWGRGDFSLLMTATVISPGSLAGGLGLDLNDGDYIEMPCPFPVENRPIFATRLDMSMRARDESWPRMVAAIDNLLNHHSAHKGLILTPSNAMMTYIMKGVSSRNRSRLIPAAGEDREQKYKEHFMRKDATVLLASGFWEGADLVGDVSRFQIIPQLPRPFWAGQIKARAGIEPGWYEFKTWQKMIQGLGRSVRSDTDHAVSYVLDGAFLKEMEKPKPLIPSWMRPAVKELA